MTEKRALLEERRKLLKELINTPVTIENGQKLDYLYARLDSIRDQLRKIEEGSI